MGRAPCCEKVGLKKGRWTAEEDDILVKYIQDNGEGSWRSLPKNAGLLRCGKSCRLRWLNYLRNDLKRGNISSEEEELIIRLHSSLGNRWSLIAGHLPGRTDNEIKNHWNSHLSRRIHSFRRPTISSESIPLIMNLTKIKRKGGRTSRAAMKSNKKQSNSGSSSMSSSVETTTSSAAAANQGALMENKAQLIKNGSSPTTIVGQTEQEEILMTVDPSDIVRESEMCCRSSPGSEGRGSCTELGPFEAAGIMCPNDIMGNGMNDLNDILTFTDDSSENGFIEFNEGRESGVMGSNDTRTISEEGGGGRGGGGGDENSTGGLSSNHHISNGTENGEWYSSSSINSCFEDEWVDWDWVGVCVEQSHHKLWEDGEEMLSWCWQSSN